MFFESLPVLNLNQDSAMLAARLGDQLRKKGITIGNEHLFIATIALSHGCNTIITKKKKHFSHIKGIKIETY